MTAGAHRDSADAWIVVEEPGIQSLVQDLGRPGHAHLGVPTSGAADRASLAEANRLVGNRPDAAGIEVTVGGLVCRVTRRTLVAVTGAACPVIVDGRAWAGATAGWLESGARLELGPATAGHRAYVAVRGGLDVERVLGSRSTDTFGGLGPDPLHAGQRVPLGVARGEVPDVERAPRVPPTAGTVHVRILPGPRADWFADRAHARLAGARWRVGMSSTRVAIVLEGPGLPRRIPGELPSEGLVRGAVQVPPGGPAAVMLADHPVTGGYPVLAVVVDRDVDLLAQARPGQAVRFTPAR